MNFLVDNLGRVWCYSYCGITCFHVCHIFFEFNNNSDRHGDTCHSTLPTGAIPKWHTTKRTWGSYTSNTYAYSAVRLQPPFCTRFPDQRTSCSNLWRTRRVCISTGIFRCKFGCLCATDDDDTHIAWRLGQYSC